MTLIYSLVIISILWIVVIYWAKKSEKELKRRTYENKPKASAIIDMKLEKRFYKQ